MAGNSINHIGFVSTRIAGTDGVSLEIEKWAKVLQRNGYRCFYMAGELDRPTAVSLLVEQAHFEHPEVNAINQSMFQNTKRSAKISEQVDRLRIKLKDHLYAFVKRFDIDLLITENALTIPMNIPLGLALTEFIAETSMPVIAHHHDFYWERERFLINACQDYLDKGFPPDLASIRHVVINSLASKQLSHRLGISNTIIPNVYDYANEPPPADPGRCAELRREIGLANDAYLILQPTRIVPRKWIERSIEIVRNLELKHPALIISHSAGDEGDDYYKRIVEYASNMGVNLNMIDHLIGSRNDETTFSIADAYQCADIITYPSGFEGFGNAFLETIYYRKPIVVNRYTIYIADIEPKGFDVITMDGFVSKKAIDAIRHILKSESYRKSVTDRNYALAKRYFSFEILERKLLYLIDSFKY